MLKAPQILVRSIALAACAASLAFLAGCGQKGPLYLPTDPAARDRATLPETLGISRRPAADTKPASKADTPETDDIQDHAGDGRSPAASRP
jgi:predicted small lipoprotein YifL